MCHRPKTLCAPRLGGAAASKPPSSRTVGETQRPWLDPPVCDQSKFRDKSDFGLSYPQTTKSETQNGTHREERRQRKLERTRKEERSNRKSNTIRPDKSDRRPTNPTSLFESPSGHNRQLISNQKYQCQQSCNVKILVTTSKRSMNMSLRALPVCK